VGVSTVGIANGIAGEITGGLATVEEMNDKGLFTNPR